MRLPARMAPPALASLTLLTANPAAAAQFVAPAPTPAPVVTSSSPLPAAPVLVVPPPVMPPSAASAGDDAGRLLGHFTYPEAGADDLAAAPAGFALGQPCRVRAAMLPDLARMLAAADAAGLGQGLRGLSCYRSVARQQAVFCRGGRCADATRRAISVGPPGHSEHATGYAIDFAVRPDRGCRDVSDCIADTPAGRWLLAHGPAYGFELSFPAGNAQGVTYEPWHWRWVGTSQDAAGAAAARAGFAAARVRFPARPEEIGFALRPTNPPEWPVSPPGPVEAMPTLPPRSP